MLLLGWICAGCFACLFVFMLAMNKKMYKDLVMYCNMYHAENRKFQIASFVSSKTQSGMNKFFADNGYKKAAVYGTGILFNLFWEELKASDQIEITYYIDRYDTRESIDGIRLLKMEPVDNTLDVDVILVTVLYEYEKIKQQLTERVGDKIKIVNIEEAVYWY